MRGGASQWHRQLVTLRFHQQRSQGDSAPITPEAKGAKIRLPGQILGLGIPSVKLSKTLLEPGSHLYFWHSVASESFKYLARRQRGRCWAEGQERTRTVRMEPSPFHLGSEMPTDGCQVRFQQTKPSNQQDTIKCCFLHRSQLLS